MAHIGPVAPATIEPAGYADAVPLYVAAGWVGVLPLPARAKRRPPKIWLSRDEAISFHGRDGVDPTGEQLATWRRRYPHGNVALRLPAGVLGLDLDLYKPAGVASYARLVAECGPLPPTWVSTSRTDGSGIRLFRVPAGICWSEGRAGDGIELIHHGHRYAVVWPSVHPDGRRYQLLDPQGRAGGGRVPVVGELPALPAVWGRWLAQPRQLAPTPVNQDTHGRGAFRPGGGYAAASLDGAVTELSAMRDGSGRNNALNRKAFALGGLVAAGHLDHAQVRDALYEAAHVNGHLAKHGQRQTLATIESGLRAGMARPRRSA